MSGIKLKELLSKQIKEVYRLVVLDEDSLQERASFRLSPLNVYIAISSTLIAVIVLIFLLVVYTPLKEYIPGYADPGLRKNLKHLTLRLDSAETALNQNKLYLENLLQVIEGKAGMKKDSLRNVNPTLYDADLLELSKGSDSILKRMLVEMSGNEQLTNRNLQGGYPWPLTKAKVINRFSPAKSNQGIGLASSTDSLVYSVHAGCVVYAGYLPGFGESLLIQAVDGHLFGYGNLGECLKKTGNFVKTAEVIGFSNNRKIQFALWVNGNPIDPTPLFQSN